MKRAMHGTDGVAPASRRWARTQAGRLCHTRGIWPVLLALLPAIMVPSCDSSKDRETPRKTAVRITAIVGAVDDATWTALVATRPRIQEQLGVPCNLVILAPQTASPRDQRALLEGIRSEEVDAVCVAPTDPEAIRSVVDDLAQKGVPVVTIGCDIPGSLRALHCGPSDEEIGRAAVRACAEVIKDGVSTVMLLHAGQDDPVYGKRYVGFMRDLPLHAELTLFREVNCGPDRADSLRLVRAESKKYPRAGCWVFLDDWPLRALADDERLLPVAQPPSAVGVAPPPSTVRVVLCNASPRYFPRLRDGQISALVGYDYEEAASAAVIAAATLASDRHGNVTAPPTPVRIITARNLPEIEQRWSATTRRSGEE
jgi:ABC-type sugar transport system substrate-binding protein